MTSRLPWTRIVVEGVVIVVSILLAFGIDAWWGVRGERRLEAEYVSRLQAELERELPTLQAFARNLSAANAAMDELLSPEAQSNGLSEDELLTSVMAGGGYEINAQTMSVDQTYSEMLATGSLRLIEDVAMREQITGYYRLVAQTVGALEVSTSEGHRAFASRVRGAVGPFNRPGVSEADLEDPAVRARLLNLVPRTDETRAELRFIRSRLDNLANNLARIEGATRALIVALEDYGR